MTRSCYTIAVYKGKGEGTPLPEKIRQTVFDLALPLNEYYEQG